MTNNLKKEYILAVESSESICSVALGNHWDLLGEYSLNIKNIHNERLAVFIHSILREHNIQASEISFLGISAGPGSYTGLRIGFSLARGFAFPNKTRLIPVPTPELYAFKLNYTDLPIISIINAHRNELYMGRYRFQQELLEEEEPIRIIKIKDLLKNFGRKKMIITGSAVKILENLDSSRIPARWILAGPQFQYVSGKDLIHYIQHLKRHHLLDRYNLEEPLYVRDFKGTY
jgi:tRNA threonylcarbamoyladenosine biosynthesis protein TsaB